MSPSVSILPLGSSSRRLRAVVRSGAIVFLAGGALWFFTGCVPDANVESALEIGSEFGEANGPGAVAPPETGDWWSVFRDPSLEQLLEQLRAQNPTGKAALARYDEARAALGLARVDQFPEVTGQASAIRFRDSAGGVFVPPDLTYNEYRAALNLQYEIDLWGRVRSSVAAARSDLEAAGADLAATRLSLEAELARIWFQWRYVKEEQRILARTIEVRERNRRLVEARVRGGEVNELDLERARTELEVARAQAIGLEREEAELRHALAALVGQVPSQFTIPGSGGRGVGRAPTIPAGVPSELLERRPDIAAAEQRLSAAASRVDVIQASFLPKVTLTGIGGVSTLRSSEFFDADSLFGTIGPDVEIPIYEGGRLVNEGRRANAVARETLADYEEIVLTAFREVEDALSGIRFLDREITAHQRAVEAAEKAAEISRRRYQGGLVSYLEVVDAERTALDEELALARARSARQLASVQLIRSLGGGWKKAD